MEKINHSSLCETETFKGGISDNDIKKALNGADGLEHISVYCADNNGEDVCSIKLVDIIDLINRQQAEIERLQKLLSGAEDCIDEIEYALDKVGTSYDRVDEALAEWNNLLP